VAIEKERNGRISLRKYSLKSRRKASGNSSTGTDEAWLNGSKEDRRHVLCGRELPCRVVAEGVTAQAARPHPQSRQSISTFTLVLKIPSKNLQLAGSDDQYISRQSGSRLSLIDSAPACVPGYDNNCEPLRKFSILSLISRILMRGQWFGDLYGQSAKWEIALFQRGARLEKVGKQYSCGVRKKR